MDSMIEVNDLQGRAEGSLQPMEISIGHGHDDEKVSRHWLMSRLPTRSRRNRRCLIVLLSVILIIAVVYVVDRTHNSLEPFERESGFVENDVPNENENENENENMQQVNKDETAEPNSHFDDDSKINNDNNNSSNSNEAATTPEQDGVGDDGNNNNSNNNTVETEEDNQQPAIIVDEKDVFCEDLSQYQKWHETNVTKKDGVMYKIVKKYNHDSNAFTQGLTYARGQLYESDGLYGKSTVRIVDKDNANVMKKVNMAKQYFAEGLAYYKDTLVQITWKSKQGFVYNISTLEEISNFTFTTTVNQGWGITWDRCKDELIVTDGSENIHFWDPKTMKEKRRISVKRLDSTLAKEMNEIEFWRGRILANVWHEDVMLVINPETGVVEKEYDFSELWPTAERKAKRADVFNGISVSADPNALYVTGKLWDRMFTVELLPDL